MVERLVLEKAEAVRRLSEVSTILVAVVRAFKGELHVDRELVDGSAGWSIDVTVDGDTITMTAVEPAGGGGR